MKFNKKRLFAALALAGLFVSASCDTIETIQTSTSEVTSLSETTSETSYEISSEESSSTTSTTIKP